MGVVFAKGCEFLLMSLGEGFGVRWVVGGGFSAAENKGKKGTGCGEGGGGGDRQRNWQVNAHVCVKTTL